MTSSYQFIEEQDLILNDTFYFTRKNGQFVPGSMSKDYDIAFTKFKELSQNAIKNDEKVLYSVEAI